MANRLARNLLILATLVLLTSQYSDAQSPGQPPPPPSVSAPPKPTPAPQAKELSAEEIDTLIEKAFGKSCQELKRPVRVWIAGIGMVIAAEKSMVAEGHLSVRFTSASAGFPNSAELKVFRGDEIVVGVDQPVGKPNAFTDRRVTMVGVHGKNSVITLTPSVNAIRNAFTTVDSINLTAPVPAPTQPQVLEKERVAIEFALKDIMEQQVITRAMEVRFKFKIDSKTPLADLLPAQPKIAAKAPIWTNEDLTKVPDLTFGELTSKELGKLQAMETTAHVMAKVNHLNLKKTDGFMLAMLENRSDLRGLPFLMGEECRTREEQAKVFKVVVNSVHQAVRNLSPSADPVAGFDANLQQARSSFPGVHHGLIDRATVAAFMQIAMPEPEHLRTAVAKYLARIPSVDATKALAKLAIFSPEDQVRVAAIEGLKLRRERDYTDVLLQGLSYPLPAVSKRAAEALVKLERKDLLASLVEVLDSPDPRLPVTEKRDGKDVAFVRELVKVNHHRNCLLCHAPGNTDNTPDSVLKVAVPLPSEPLPKPSDGGGYQSAPPATPDIVVRLDMTYLRQDFSLMMPVSDPHPWPEMQRFDFLVRTRTLTAAEAQAYEPCCEADEPGRLSPYHRSALFALRELTGRDTEPTAAAWRKLLKLAAR